ncbi:MAG: flagellar basal body-associated protein FliL [Candidatus Latescibacterota bacterium]|jgi:flagellar basal body-associated protein FliL
MNKYMPLVILVVLGQTVLAYLLVNNVVIYRLSGPPLEELQEVEVDISVSDKPERIYRDMGEFLINPADSVNNQGFRFIQTEITLGVSPARVHDKLAQQNLHLRDTVIRVLSAKKLAELDSPDDREYIKDELRFALNEHLGDSEEILQINFLKFIVQ